MAKGLRSKIKKHFRTIKRATVSSAQKYKERESIKEEKLREILEAPKPTQSTLNADEEIPCPSPAAMETDDNLPELTTKNPAKLARKLRERRLAKEKGILQKAKKKSKPLAGANQFHKKGRKKKR